MIDNETYRCRIGTYSLNTKSSHRKSHSDSRNFIYSCSNVDGPQNIIFFILYAIFIVYFTAFSMSIISSFSSSHSPHANLYDYPRYNILSEHCSTYVKLFCCILCYHVLKRLIRKQIYLQHENSFSVIQVFKMYLNVKQRSHKIILCSIIWIYLLNFLSVSIVNPSLINPGPDNSLSIFYQNVQGLIPFSELRNVNPKLNVTKLFELQSYVSKHKPDLVVLNETWLKKSILDNEILPTDHYNIFRLDRSPRSHPPDSTNVNKFRKNGGGVLIAVKSDLKLNAKEIKPCGGAEIIALELVMPNGNSIVVCTCYRVGTLEADNHNRIVGFLESMS